MSWARPGISTDELRTRHPLARLVRPRVGLVDEVAFLWQDYGVPRFAIATAELDNLTMTFPHVIGRDGGDARDTIIGGAGSDLDTELAWVKAVAEAAERYATLAFDERDFVVAAGRELGADAIDLTRIPRCSPRELADPKCPLRAPDPAAPIRWVRGRSLTHGCDRLVPAVMTHLYLQAWPAERFCIPISTGVAAHPDLAAALGSALCEVIERDATALTWLTRRPLRRIAAPEASAGGKLGELAARMAASPARYELFDATTDVGVPTAFAVQRSPGHPGCKVTVTCATSPSPEDAFHNAVRETAPARAALTAAREIPADVADFHDLVHGAAYYGRSGDLADFRFLLDGTARTSLAEMGAGGAPADARGRLRWLVDRLAACGMEAIAVDLTTDELREVGLWVVRVVVPELMPISFIHRARYLGTPRLYQAWRERGAADEAAVHPGPLPFA